MRPVASTAVALFLALPQVGHAESPFEFYGQLNFGLFDFDDGTDRSTKFLNNDNSNTRIGIWYRHQFANGTTLKFNLETALGFEESDEVTIDDNKFDFDQDRTDWRHIELIYDTARYGVFYLGQGSMSADGVTEFDLSGTDVITYASVSDLAGAIQFREKGLAPSSVEVENAFSDLDGSRRLRARYDTPSFNGFTFSASYGDEWLDQSNKNDYTDIAVRYSNDFQDLQVRGGIAYQWIDNKRSPNEQRVNGSVAVLHTPTGISGLIAGASEDKSDKDFLYGKLGYQQDWFSFGTTHLSVDYYDGDDFSTKGSDSKSWSLAAVQKIDQFNLEVYAAYRNYDFDSSGTNFEDIKVYSIGARWKF
jgi:hypothetical protein